MRIAINGFGRIGRVFARLASKNPNLDLVAVNDIHDSKSLIHLFKYDSTHGVFQGEVESVESDMLLNNSIVRFFNEKDPRFLPWAELGIDIVIEATGQFKTSELASKHLEAGCKKVIITAPSEDTQVKTIVLGVSDESTFIKDTIISNASCTTNNAAPMIHLIDELCGIESCYITTVHSFTGDQKLLDAPHKDLRRGRAAAQSIVPTTTGAAKALTKIFPHIHDVIGGCGIRVPVIDGSLTDITCIVRKDTSVEELNQYFKKASNGQFKDILQYSETPLVSRDIIGNSHSCVYDSGLTSVIGKMVKVVGWYDNEVGYSNRLIDLARIIA